MLSESVVLDRYRGARVALVGNAASVELHDDGTEIEAADVVVRCNFGAPVPDRMTRHVGRRTDVLYSVLVTVEGTGPITPADVQAWVRAEVGILVSTHPSRHHRARLLPQLCDPVGLRWTCAQTVRSAVKARLRRRTVPNTGMVALAHILCARPRRLDVYGFDFYGTGHWHGQSRETPEAADAQRGGALHHDQQLHRALFEQWRQRYSAVMHVPRLAPDA